MSMRRFVMKLLFLVALLSLAFMVKWPFQSQSMSMQKEEEAIFMKQMQSRMNSRRNHVKQTCEKQGILDDKLSVRQNMIYSKRYKVLFCQIPKTGMTNWMKLFAKLDGLPSTRRSGTDLKRYFKRNLQLNNPDIIQRKLEKKEVVKLLVVREPLERLLSAFRDKLDDRPISYYKRFSKMLQKSQGNHTDGKFASFDKFISYLVNTPALKNGDLHWKMYRHLCQPCAVDYDIIVHEETMLEDSRYFLNLIGAPKHLFLKGKYKHPTDETVIDQYYTNVQPRENLEKLVHLLQDDYLLFNYTRPM